jgi:hypothetical protein
MDPGKPPLPVYGERVGVRGRSVERDVSLVMAGLDPAIPT